MERYAFIDGTLIRKIDFHFVSCLTYGIAHRVCPFQPRITRITQKWNTHVVLYVNVFLPDNIEGFLESLVAMTDTGLKN